MSKTTEKKFNWAVRNKDANRTYSYVTGTVAEADKWGDQRCNRHFYLRQVRNIPKSQQCYVIPDLGETNNG